MLDQIRIVLVNTSHTGNMGSAARAMKTMGLTQLVLVDPQALPDDDAIALAAGASWQDNSVRAEALRKLRRVIFMVESSFFDNMTSQPPLDRGG